VAQIYKKYLKDTSTKISPDEYISQAEAARIRGVSSQAIADLIDRGRLPVIRVAGRKLLLRKDVESFAALPRTGRPPKKAAKKQSKKT
jgi:excisionase family DNA binding protein